MEVRDSNGRFTKGSIGNPKGRPKKQPEAPTPEEVLNAATMEAVTRLIDLVHSENEEIALHASIAVLDRTIERGKIYIPVPDCIKAISMSFDSFDNKDTTRSNKYFQV